MIQVQRPLVKGNYPSEVEHLHCLNQIGIGIGGGVGIQQVVHNAPPQIDANVNFNSWYYICGIQGFVGENNNILPSKAGGTIRHDPSSTFFGSLIAYEIPIQHQPKPYQNIGDL